jgi:uncharacterized membrane protein YhiD involved in acid resistance
MDLVIESVTKLLIAAILGGMVGLERELSRKPAGLRTNMLICTGSALLMILSILVAGGEGGRGDPGRIAAQVVTGIGFLGAGAIVQSRGSVYGLTTGATIFTVAAIGLAVGGGYYLPALLATGIVILSLFALGMEIVRAHGGEVEELSVERTGEHVEIRFGLSISPEANERVLRELLAVSGRVRLELLREG